HDNWRGLNDRFAFGPSLAMNMYANRLDEAVNMLREGTRLNPEIFLAEHLRNARISISRTRVTHHLLRYSALWRARFLVEQGDDLLFQPRRPMASLKDQLSAFIGSSRYDKLASIWWQRQWL
ncbi:MAG: hypothetical protein VKM34_00725, partial [Cyanobacteriota bacterium]|nr:hypothetical protein [Cyanobacteriota bacterium]